MARALIPLLVLAPLTVFADDVPEAPTAEPAPVVAAPAATPVAAPAETDWCGAHRYAHWHHHRGQLSIGFSKGHVETEDEVDGSQRSLVARLNGRRGWSIELELSKLSLDGGDSMKTGGASLVKAFGRHELAPYVIAGIGGGRYEFPGGGDQRVHFAEAGAGLMLRKKHFSIGADVRRGVRKLDGDDEVATRMTTPSDTDDRERYVRGRILALINF